jgi:predicted lysophospholipase L1 biosynthesis ABC-type transport system permease subunit
LEVGLGTDHLGRGRAVDRDDHPSLRTVDQRFGPNFFVVFEPGVSRSAAYVVLVTVTTRRARRAADAWCARTRTSRRWT